MYMSQKRIIPRWKEWKPLATQQFRLRNLIQIIGINVGAEDLEGKKYKTPVDKNQSSTIWYYYTLHLTAMSAPFYTSERLESECPKWKEIDTNLWTNAGVFGGTQGFILRLWCHNVYTENDEILTVWGVHLTGLVYLGTLLSSDSVPDMPNTIIFLLPGGYYTMMMKDSDKLRISSVKVAKQDLRQSYSTSMIHRLTAIQKTIAQKFAQVEAIKLKISTGDYVTSDSRGSATLRRILSKSKPKSNHQDIIKLKENIEQAKFYCQTLQEERIALSERVRLLRGRLESLSDDNGIKESQIMEKYRLFQREVQAHRQWLVGHIERREVQTHAKAELNFRIKQLISQLQLIYPLERHGDKLTICGVYLPDSENFDECDDLQVSVGLGFVAHVIQMASVFTFVPLRYPVIHFGSRSRILDLIADKMPDSEREFPLYSKGKDKLQFNYAVYLLNKNIAALRFYHGLGTQDLRCTLFNLEGLLKLSEISEATTAATQSPGIEIASSSISISSPIPSHSYAQKLPWQRLSESSNAGPVAPMLAIDVANTLTSNLSYSLDKGLNEFEELKRKAQPGTQVATTMALPTGGSESNLPSVSVTKNKLCAADDAITSDYLKNWNANERVIFSDSDSDINNSGVYDEKTVIRLGTEDETVSDRISVGLEACDTPVENGLQKQPEAVLSSTSEPAVSDSLLDNVTNRTEALANQTSSFNMFRPRFRSTLEDTN